jgi:hypothetical protein
MTGNLRKYVRENIRISSNENFDYLKIKDKIIIYSVELKIPIASLDINNGITFFFKVKNRFSILIYIIFI